MRRFVSCLLLCAAALPRAGVAEDVGCARDTDCKGERICEQRVCVEPPSSSAQSKPALPPRALDVPPAARVVREESLTGLWVAGTITASVVYVVTVALAAPLSDPSVRGQALTYTLIPVFGPFILNGSAIGNPQYSAPLIFSGVVQLAGVGMVVAGLVIHQPVEEASATPLSTLSVQPMLIGQRGLLASVRF